MDEGDKCGDKRLTSFTVFPIKTISTKTKQVFTSGQRRERGASIETDPIYKPK